MSFVKYYTRIQRPMLSICLFSLSIIEIAFSANCYECSSISGDCTGRTCVGEWCVARIVQSKSPKNNIYTKECSSTNPNAGKPGECVKVETGGTTAISCGCQRDLCNSQESIIAMLSQNGTVAEVVAKHPATNDSLSVTDNETLVSCYECNSVVGDCTVGDCKGRWCKTSISEDSSAGTKVVSKGCSTTHPNAVAYDGCVKVTSQSVTTISCGCRKSEFCNTARNVEVWLSRPAPTPANLSSSTVERNSNNHKNVESSAAASKTNAKLRCHCTQGAADGCSNGECYSDLCAWTTIKPDTPTVAKQLVRQYCPIGEDLKKRGCEKSEANGTTVSGLTRQPESSSSVTCFCDAADFCNSNSSPNINSMFSIGFYSMTLATLLIINRLL